MAITNQDGSDEEIKSWLNSGNAVYHLVHQFAIQKCKY